MHGKRWAAVGVTALATLATAVSAAAETLDDAWQLALAADQRLAAAELRTAAADEELEAARAGRRPNLTTGATTSRWNDTPAFDFAAAGVPIVLPLFDGQALNMAEARLSLPLYSGGALTANVAAATAARTENERAAQALLADVKLAVAEAYVGVLRATRALAVARSTTASLGAHTRDVDDRRRTGEVANNDYLAAAVSLADAEQRELQAVSGLEVAAALYNRHIGRPLDTAVMLEPLNGPLDGALATQTLADLIEHARATRAELAGLDAAATAWQARADAVAAARRPQLTVSGGYTYLENTVLREQDYWSLSLGVRWSPFDSGQTRHTATAVTRQLAAVSAERSDLALAIELDVRRAWHARDAARARIAVATSAVQQAEENLRVVRDRYRNGEGTNTEVLDAESLRTLSLGNLDTARYDASLAELTLAHAVGSL